MAWLPQRAAEAIDRVVSFLNQVAVVPVAGPGQGRFQRSSIPDARGLQTVSALNGLRFWTWDTGEVLDLIRRMRRNNADPDTGASSGSWGSTRGSPAWPPPA